MRRALVALGTSVLLFGACDGNIFNPMPGHGTTTTTTTTTPNTLGQAAVWPAPSTVFDTPEAAAADFVAQALGVPPVLGEFQQGDSRSGEIEVFSQPENGGTAVLRSRLLLRRLGTQSGWFVLAAVNDNATVDSPSSGAAVPAGPVTVSGVARGFEGAVTVTAFRAGDAAHPLDQEHTQGGSFATPEPFTVTLDLSAAPAGQTIAILVRGGTGLETDPGDFGAIPVVIAG
jgi:hypothetical protein